LNGIGLRGKRAGSSLWAPPNYEFAMYRFVGIFYFLTHSGGGPRNPGGDGPYDVAKILAQDPDAAKKPDSPLWGKIGTSHYWSEPLYGYYRSTDP
jgi:hypothetical protein